MFGYDPYIRSTVGFTLNKQTKDNYKNEHFSQGWGSTNISFASKMILHGGTNNDYKTICILCVVVFLVKVSDGCCRIPLCWFSHTMGL